MDDEKTALCIRNVANFSAMKPAYSMEKPVFNPELFNLAAPLASPKIGALFEKIARLDAKDMRTSGKHFKHMIFSDIQNSQYGVKLLASAFAAKGFTPVFRANGPGFAVKHDQDLQETAGNNFGVLCSKKFMDRNMSVRFRKAILDMYNARPENTQGENMRFIILDQGFKEGIDLYDVKYIHLFEPLTIRADEKQAIGRGTRFCGQKGLEFHPRFGWTLYIFRYDVDIPHGTRITSDADTLSQLYLEYSNIDVRRVTFAAELEKASQDAAVDHALTAPIHQFKMEVPPPALASTHDQQITHRGGAELRPSPPYRIMNYGSMGNYIRNHFMRFKYPPAKLENLCSGGGSATGGAPQLIEFTPTQNFVRHYFQPESAYKGLLLYHSVGAGKTCTAIATATNSFEKEGYTILWVTRHTLKSDIWKNMFKQVCSMELRSKLRKGDIRLPEKISGQMKYMSKQWVEPMSYKQFTNMLLKKNQFYEEILRRNGEVDPLRKTLIIIDEAHKMYAPGAPASEKPDMAVFEKMILNSYKKSGKDSCRLLVMTATPFTEDGMEMIKLLNLLKKKRDHLPTDFESFSRTFLDRTGAFTKVGLNQFRNDVSGYISYLNRSQDGRNFAHPVLEEVHVDMTLSPETESSDEIAARRGMQNAALRQSKEELKNKKAELKEVQKEMKEKQKECKGEIKEKKKQCVADAKEEYQNQFATGKDTYEAAVEECKTEPRAKRVACKSAAKEEWNAAKEQAKRILTMMKGDCEKINDKDCDTNVHVMEQNTRLSRIQKEIEETMAHQKEQVEIMADKKAKERELMMAARELRPEVQQLNQMRKSIAARLSHEKVLLRAIENKEERKRRSKQLRETLGAEYKAADAQYKQARAKMNQRMNDRKVLRLKEGKAKLGDISQETALIKRCKQ